MFLFDDDRSNFFESIVRLGMAQRINSPSLFENVLGTEGDNPLSLSY